MRIPIDLHVHTVASGHAYSTVKEIAQAAAEKGLEGIAITDHGPAMPGGPHPYYFGNLKAIPKTIHGVRVFRGVEANIMDVKGTLDLEPRYMKHLDLILAGFHAHCFPGGCSRGEHTRAVINTIKSGLADIIVHPGNPQFLINVEEVVGAAKEYGVALEINNASLTVSRVGSIEHCPLIAKVAAREGILISLGSDSHWADTVGDFGEALALAQEAGIKEENILNTSMSKLKSFMERRKENRPTGKKIKGRRPWRNL